MKKKVAQNNYPAVDLGSTPFESSAYVRGDKKWRATTLLQEVKIEKLKPFKYPIACFDLTIKQKWMNEMDCLLFCTECKRLLECDTNKPIILDDCGQIADGYHRMFKSIILGKRFIMAYRLNNMPEPDEIIKTNSYGKERQ